MIFGAYSSRNTVSPLRFASVIYVIVNSLRQIRGRLVLRALRRDI